MAFTWFLWVSGFFERGEGGVRWVSLKGRHCDGVKGCWAMDGVSLFLEIRRVFTGWDFGREGELGLQDLGLFLPSLVSRAGHGERS